GDSSYWSTGRGGQRLIQRTLAYQMCTGRTYVSDFQQITLVQLGLYMQRILLNHRGPKTGRNRIYGCSGRGRISGEHRKRVGRGERLRERPLTCSPGVFGSGIQSEYREGSPKQILVEGLASGSGIVRSI